MKRNHVQPQTTATHLAGITTFLMCLIVLITSLYIVGTFEFIQSVGEELNQGIMEIPYRIRP